MVGCCVGSSESGTDFSGGETGIHSHAINFLCWSHRGTTTWHFHIGNDIQEGEFKGKVNSIVLVNISKYLSLSFLPQGAIWGSAVSIIIVGIILVGSHVNKLAHPFLPMSTDNCDLSGSSNVTVITQRPSRNPEEVPWIFRISFLYYSVLSLIFFLAVAVPVSLFTTDPNDKSYEAMDQRMLAPFCRDQNLYRKQTQQNYEKELKSLIPEKEEKGVDKV